MIQKTSLEAFQVLEPTLGYKQKLIYNFLKVYPDISNHDIAGTMALPINTVTPRVKELRDKGLIVHSGYKVDPITNKRVMVWRVI